MNPTVDLSPIQASMKRAADEKAAEVQRRHDALSDLLGETDISVTLLDGNTIYVGIGCAEMLYTDGYAVKNGALYQTVD